MKVRVKAKVKFMGMVRVSFNDTFRFRVFIRGRFR